MPIIIWVGLGLFVVGVLLMRREHRIVLDSPRVEARIVELVKGNPSQSGAVKYTIRVGFKTGEGEEVVFELAPRTDPRVKVGDPVRIAYDRADPHRVRVLSFGYRYAFLYCVVGLGLLFLFIGGGIGLGNELMRKVYVPASASAPR